MGLGKIKQALVFGIALSVLFHLIGIAVYHQYLQQAPEPKAKNPINVRMVPPGEYKKRQIIDIPKSTPKPAKDPKYLAEQDSFAEEDTQKQGNPADISPSSEMQPGQSNPPEAIYPKPSQRQGKEAPSMKELLPTFQELKRMQFPGSNDHLEDVQKGSVTQLNASKWQFASFFTRVKTQVSRIWDPTHAVKIHDPRGLLLRDRSYLTELTITIDQKGTMVNAKITKKCGLEFLDDEAMAAFFKAEPFPNPPKAMFEGKEKFTFQFGFYLDAASGLGFDLNWRP